MFGRVGESLDGLVYRWRSRSMETWCHGALHPGNVLTRHTQTHRIFGPELTDPVSDLDEGVLIDLGLVHSGHWVEDALYLERLYWGQPEGLGGVDPVAALAQARARLGLRADVGEAEEIAVVRRVLMAATRPAFLTSEGHPEYLAAALDRLTGAGRAGLI